jgi:hypothetical protein
LGWSSNDYPIEGDHVKIATQLLLGACLLSGCARVTHTPVAAEQDANATGVRYYRSSPYLLVYFNTNGEREWKILALPDVTLKMQAKPFNVWSKVDTDMTFANGVLTETTDAGDATVVPKAIVEAIEKVLPLLLAAPANKTSVSEPVIYKVVIRENQVFLKGFKTVQII